MASPNLTLLMMLLFEFDVNEIIQIFSSIFSNPRILNPRVLISTNKILVIGKLPFCIRLLAVVSNLRESYYYGVLMWKSKQ